MSKPVSKTLIGAFVIGALALAVTAVIIFGSGKFLKETRPFVMYFEHSVKGLNVGSPVMFRGVKIGSVTDVKLVFDPNTLSLLIPVYVEFDPGRLVPTVQIPRGWLYLDALVKKGLKAQLQTESFVTGQRAVTLDFFPDKPIKFVGMDKRFPEVPTLPSTMEELAKSIEDLPWKDIVQKIDSAMSGLDRLVNSNSAAVGSTIQSAQETLKEGTVALRSINAKIGPIMANLQNTSESLRSATAKVDKALSGEKGIPAQAERTFEGARQALAEAQKTFERARQTLAQAEKTLVTVQETTSDNSVLVVQAGDALEEVNRSARTIRSLADYLERHPESLIRGKKNP